MKVDFAIERLREGKMVIVVDDPKRENQGDVIFAGEKVTPDKVNFLLKNCRGIICTAITKEKALRLKLPLMVPPLSTTEKTKVQFTISCDSKNVSSFGISTKDRAETIKVLADPKSRAEDLVRPGHVFPLLARDKGLLERRGHTEAGVDLMRMAKLSPCAVLCEVLNEKGNPANFSQLKRFSQKFKIPILTINEIVEYLKIHPLTYPRTKSILKEAESKLFTKYGEFLLRVYRAVDGKEHLALIYEKEKINPKEPILVRIHSQCLTGEVFFSLKCDCREQLERSFQLIKKRKKGVLIYLNQEGRGIGLVNKIRAYSLQEKGIDTVKANLLLNLPPDARDYQMAVDILKDLNIKKIEILTNNPQKISELEKGGIRVVKRIPIECLNLQNKKYLKAKKEKLGHLIKNV